MRKYVVPCAALLGIALLSPRANAANLIIKSRVVPPAGTSYPVKDATGTVTTATATGNVSIPISVDPTSLSDATKQLWGLDAAFVLPTGVTAQTTGFVAQSTNFDATKDVSVSGSAFVGTGTQPNAYFGVVKGGAGFDLTQAIGLVKLNVGASGGALGATLPLAPIANYNVLNTGDTTGSTRAGATGVLSTATAGATLTPETIGVAPNGTGNVVPYGIVALGVPGDVTGNAIVDVSDVTLAKFMIVGTQTATAYRLVAGDIAPSNGYTAANPAGTGAGAGYGNGVFDVSDLTLLKSYVANASAGLAQFPRPE